MGQLAGAAGVPSQATPVETNRVEFGLFWPPKDPTETLSPDAAPLLNGSLIVRLDALPDDGRVARLRVTLTRPSDEAGRERWNSTLAFPQYDWMRYVRVWDADKQWLWPNLPYVLRLHGIERVDRYGGVDPGKGVDDDFAAVLIRKYAGTTTNEAETTRRFPLVAAEWHPVGASMPVNKETIVHVAQSDEFSLDLGRVDGKKQGWAAVWLIYADFMGAKVPGSWPKTLEFTGGILAYFEVHWDLQAMPGHQVVLRHLTPRQSTGFDWERWARRTRVAQNPAITACAGGGSGGRPGGYQCDKTRAPQNQCDPGRQGSRRPSTHKQALPRRAIRTGEETRQPI
ncbi:MAG: hypothetical protein NTW03_11675 [Verrucomicrobia bacterium]|nr:hypothetical protein [Verrucomicrobiota bacterium]